MSIKNCIRKATQYNCCLDRKAICMKHSWDEVSKMLDTFCDCKNAANVKNAKNAQNVSADNLVLYIFFHILTYLYMVKYI